MKVVAAILGLTGISITALITEQDHGIVSMCIVGILSILGVTYATKEEE